MYNPIILSNNWNNDVSNNNNNNDNDNNKLKDWPQSNPFYVALLAF